MVSHANNIVKYRCSASGIAIKADPTMMQTGINIPSGGRLCGDIIAPSQMAPNANGNSIIDGLVAYPANPNAIKTAPICSRIKAVILNRPVLSHSAIVAFVNHLDNATIAGSAISKTRLIIGQGWPERPELIQRELDSVGCWQPKAEGYHVRHVENLCCSEHNASVQANPYAGDNCISQVLTDHCIS
jgi:hypothetical protein